MVYSICLKCPTTKTEKRNVVSQIKASQDTKPLNHNSDMIETPIIKEQEALEPISYPENSTLHNNSQNDPESRSRRNHLPLEISSIENDLISDTDIKQQTQDITNLQNVCSIEEALLGPDISFKKASLEDREMNAFLDREYKKKVSNEIRQRNRKKKLRDLDLSGTSDISSSESSIKLLIELLKEDCIKIVNVEENPVVDQSPAIKLAYLFQKIKFAEINTI
ncbi:8899_t:CDS:2 [Rhizophagus irregularis]|nr:8899_t:CDS:2 [Rhizophagus irregularis]